MKRINFALVLRSHWSEFAIGPYIGDGWIIFELAFWEFGIEWWK